MADSDLPEEIVWQGKFVTAKRKGRWEYVGRELEEETGYRAARLESLGEYYSSPGMVSESFTLVRATGLQKVGDGGGVDDEGITPHRVRIADLQQFLDDKRADGCGIDVRLLLLLGSQLI